MPDVRMRLPLGNAPVTVDLGPDIADAIRRSGDWYERHIMALLPHVLPADGVAFDVGANSGAITLALACVASQGHVVAFEAARANADRLVANLARVGATHVRVERVAVYDRAAQLTLTYAEESTGGASVSTRDEVTAERVEAVALDDWAATTGLARLDLVKIDVEGSELRVLRGARRTLERFRPTILLECNPVALRQQDDASTDDLLDELERLDYRLGWVVGRGGVIALPDRTALQRAVAATGIIDVVAVCSGRLPGARGAQAHVGRLRAFLRVRAANRRRRPPADRFVVAAELEIEADTSPRQAEPGTRIGVPLTLTNRGASWLSSDFRRHPIFVTHHWLAPDGTTDGEEPRTPLPNPLAPTAVCRLVLGVDVPPTAGEWTLVIRAVQEHFVWLDSLDPAHARRIAIDVTDARCE